MVDWNLALQLPLLPRLVLAMVSVYRFIGVWQYNVPFTRPPASWCTVAVVGVGVNGVGENSKATKPLISTTLYTVKTIHVYLV